MADERPMQACDVCGGVDDHPRHTILYGQGQAPAPSGDALRSAIQNGAGNWSIADLLSRDRTVRHLDCCASQGCAFCRASEQVTGGKRGGSLVKAVTAEGYTEKVSALFGANDSLGV